ncbi:hypothetical protein MBLNU459_g4435t1 [Dothideomycetes sp. NU459]
MPSQAEYNAQTTIGSQDAGYIHEDELLALLIKKFPATEYPNFSGAEKDRFHIQQREEQFTFWAPAIVQRADQVSRAQQEDYRQIMKRHLPDYNALVTDGEAYKTRIAALSSTVFNNTSDVLVVDQNEVSSNVAKRTLRSDQDWHVCFNAESQPKNRIISIASDFSLDPLNITLQLMLRILYHFRVTPNFLDVLLKFGDQPQIAQESSGCNSLTKSSDGSYSICYDLRYIEANGRRAPRDPFSMRHTGVCHQYDPRSKSNVAIILHPMPESRAEKRLKALSGPSSPGDHPLNIHFLILSSYLSNWQAYIETLAEQFMGLRERVLAIDLERAQSHLQPDTLATLRNLEDKISFRTLSGLKGAINTINMLLEFNERLLKDNSIEMREYENAGNVLTAYVEKMESHVSSVEVMEKRIVATIGSLSSLLELKNQSVDLRNQTMALENQAAALENQAAADRLNEMMLKYTRESVDDNTTVKLITVFTLVYLPASFIASLLGMNLFDYDNNSGRFLTSPDLWVFFILAVPLTILTLGLGWYFDRKGRQAKHKRQSEKSGLP